MRLSTRLQKIETSLTPKQAVLLWLKETVPLGFLGYIDQGLNKPMSETPRARIPKMVAEALRENLEEQDMTPQFKRRAVDEAEREVDILIVLVRKLRDAVSSECKLNTPYSLLLYEKFYRLLEQGVHQKKFDSKEWDLWRALLTKRLSTMWKLRQAIAVIRTNYYDNHPILFEEQTCELNLHIGILEGLLSQYNNLKKSLPGWTAITFDPQSPSMQQELSREIEWCIASAKSTSLWDMGREAAAWNMIEPYALEELEQLRAGNSDVTS